MEHLDDVLTKKYPMYVMPIANFLDLERIQPHEELMEAGKLVKWEDDASEGAVLFVSHTWLSYTTPDPDGAKLKLVKTILRQMLAGQRIPAHFLAEFYYKMKLSLESRDVKRCTHVWMDYFSIPQAHREHQQLAIQSIFAYVASAAFFVVAAGSWKHREDGSTRDVRAWAGRGWCRLEQFANAMSPASKPLIIAQTPTDVVGHGPGGATHVCTWIHNTIGRGAFTVDADKEVPGPAC